MLWQRRAKKCLAPPTLHLISPPPPPLAAIDALNAEVGRKAAQASRAEPCMTVYGTCGMSPLYIITTQGVEGKPSPVLRCHDTFYKYYNDNKALDNNMLSSYINRTHAKGR